MKQGCLTIPQSYNELGWPVVDFKVTEDYSDREIAYWHVENKSEQLKLHHQVSILYKAFNSINFLLAPHWKQFISTSDPEKADVTIKFRTNRHRDLPTKFEKGVMAYALPNRIYVNDSYFWKSVKEDKGADLQFTLEHEIGHVLGLGHTEFVGDVMMPKYDPDNFWSDDSKKLLAKRYGKPFITPKPGGQLFIPIKEEKGGNMHWVEPLIMAVAAIFILAFMAYFSFILFNIK